MVGDDHARGAVLDRERARPRRSWTPLRATGSEQSRRQRLEVVPGRASGRRARRPLRRVIGRSEPTAAATAGAVTSGGTTKPVRKSRSRRPARGASTVSAIASKPALDRLVDQRPGHPAVAEAVELEPARRRRRLRGDLARPRGRDRRQAHDRPGGRRGPRHRRPRRRGRRAAGRRPARPAAASRPRLPSTVVARAHLADVDQHPRAQLPAPRTRRRCRAACARRRRRRRSSRARPARARSAASRS